MSLNRKFRQVVESPFAVLSAGDLKPIALGIWHEDYTPDTSDLDSIELQKAGYLIDRLMRYNCVSKDRKIELQKLVQRIEHKLPVDVRASSSLKNIDSIARKWHLHEDISHLISPLLEYQTRHYVHTKA